MSAKSLALRIAHPLFFSYNKTNFYSNKKHCYFRQLQNTFVFQQKEYCRFQHRFLYYNDRGFSFFVFGQKRLKESFSKLFALELPQNKLTAVVPLRWLGVVLLNSGFFQTRRAVLVGLKQGKIFVNGKVQKQYTATLRQGDFVFIQEHLFRFFSSSPLCIGNLVVYPGISAFVFLGFGGTLCFPSPQHRSFLFSKRDTLREPHKSRIVFRSQLIRLFKKKKDSKRKKIKQLIKAKSCSFSKLLQKVAQLVARRFWVSKVVGSNPAFLNFL